MITAEHKRMRPLVMSHPWISRCWAKARPLVMLYPWISRCWVKEARARKAKGDKKGKGKGKGKKRESSKDEKDKDKKGKGNGKNNVKTEYFCWILSSMQRLGTHEEGLLVGREC